MKTTKSVLDQPRQKVLVRFYGMPALYQVRYRRSRNQRRRGRHHREEEEGDTGFPLFQREPLISINGLLEELQSLGLRYVGGRWKKGEGQSTTSTLVFSTTGEVAHFPDKIRWIFESCFTSCSIWCNLRPGWKCHFRLDTINMVRPLKPDNPRLRDARKLRVVGNTYQLEKT